uniref:uncharacterized protein n=1 Tax=Lonchura striata TaxID=40157 RepID=UPI000B4CD4BF|nr:uncharacterized protein LOC110472146 [Lonchura striata domestica]
MPAARRRAGPGRSQRAPPASRGGAAPPGGLGGAGPGSREGAAGSGSGAGRAGGGGSAPQRVKAAGAGAGGSCSGRDGARPLCGGGAAAAASGGSSGPARPRPAAALGRPAPGRVSLRAPALSPRPEQRPRAGQWRLCPGAGGAGVPGQACPAPVSAEPRRGPAPRPPGAPRCRRLRARAGPWGSSPGRRGSAGAASSPEGLASLAAGGRLGRAGSGAAAAPPHRRPLGARRGSGRRALRGGLGFHSRGAPHPAQGTRVLCADSNGWHAAGRDRMLSSPGWGFFVLSFLNVKCKNGRAWRC